MKKIFSLAILVLFFQFNKAYSDDHQTPFGTEDEAKAMLERAINIVNFDKKYTLSLFTNMSGGFQLHDLYVFCATLDGTIVAHPLTVGNNMFDFYDSNGKNLGTLIIRSANENQIDKVEYMLSRMTAKDNVTELAKTTFVTKINDLVCAVGYYSK